MVPHQCSRRREAHQILHCIDFWEFQSHLAPSPLSYCQSTGFIAQVLLHDGISSRIGPSCVSNLNQQTDEREPAEPHEKLWQLLVFSTWMEMGTETTVGMTRLQRYIISLFWNLVFTNNSNNQQQLPDTIPYQTSVLLPVPVLDRLGLGNFLQTDTLTPLTFRGALYQHIKWPRLLSQTWSSLISIWVPVI